MGSLSSYSPITSLLAAYRIPVVTSPGGGPSGLKYITAANLRGPNILSLGDYAVGDDVADDSHAIRDWCLAAAAIAGPTTPVGMYVPPPSVAYKTTLAGRTINGTWPAGVTGIVPSNAYVYGVPQKSWFHFTGVPASDTDNGGAVDLDSYSVLGIADGSSNIVIEGLAFRGENTSFTYYFNNQSGCISVQPGTSAHDMLVKNCRFRDLYGFSVHDAGENEDVHVKDCWFFQCANGLNVNANGTIQTGNFMDTCEGIECSGARAVIDGNVIINAQNVGISMGGAGDFRYGVTVTNNVIDGSTGSGILVGDGCFGSIFDGNIVRKATNQGIGFGEAFAGWAPDHCIISNNTFVDCGLISAGTGVGMDLGFDNHTVTGNMCYNTGDDVLYSQSYACIVRGDNVFLNGNYFDGATRDLDVPNTAANLRLGQNFYKNNTVYWEAGGTSSLAQDNGWFKAATEKVRDHRVTGDSTGEPYSRFSEYADGKFEWGGSVGNARDTNLYRSAANVLKTDDTLAAALGLLLTEQTAPSAPATNNVIIYAVDNGSGKTKLMALFPTGSAVQIAIEP